LDFDELYFENIVGDAFSAWCYAKLNINNGATRAREIILLANFHVAVISSTARNLAWCFQ